jgi:hypothetical protein
MEYGVNEFLNFYSTKKKETKMTKEEQEIIYNKYPALYRQHSLPMTETCMMWGICVGSGWFKLIDELSAKLTAHAEKTGATIEASQVKEKFGTLRFYLDYNDDTTDKYVTAAENLSAKTCEVCGSMKNVKLRGKGWVRTRCEKCENEEK